MPSRGRTAHAGTPAPSEHGKNECAEMLCAMLLCTLC